MVGAGFAWFYLSEAFSVLDLRCDGFFTPLDHI